MQVVPSQKQWSTFACSLHEVMSVNWAQSSKQSKIVQWHAASAAHVASSGYAVQSGSAPVSLELPDVSELVSDPVLPVESTPVLGLAVDSPLDDSATDVELGPAVVLPELVDVSSDPSLPHADAATHEDTINFIGSFNFIYNLTMAAIVPR